MPAGSDGIAAPFYLSAGGIICSVIGCLCIRTKEAPPGLNEEERNKRTQDNLLTAIRLVIIIAAILNCATSALVVFVLKLGWEIYICFAIGLVAGILIGFFTEYFTSFAYRPTQIIAEASETGPATVVISVGFLFCRVLVLVLFARRLFIFHFSRVLPSV